MIRQFLSQSKLRQVLFLLALIGLSFDSWHPTKTTAATNLSGSSDKLSPALIQQSLSPDSMVSVVAFLNSDPEREMSKQASNFDSISNWRRNHEQIIKRLQQPVSSRSRFIELLTEWQRSDEVTDLREFWIADVVAFKIRASHLEELSRHPDLHYLVEDVSLELIDPVSIRESSTNLAGAPQAIDRTGVRELWNRGYTGRGRLICSFDTGVEGTHPALAHNWIGTGDVPASQGWFDPLGTTFPADLNGHGTHTMGIMVGIDGADTIGLAFNARWMSAAVIDRGQSLNKTISDIIAAFQWAADPDGDPSTVDDLPDVVCNSWGIPKGLFETCDEIFWQAIDNLEALGVVTVFACGNEGPNPSTIRNPADRTSSPTNSFSVGAVDQGRSDLLIASFSSRGPANCDDTKIKPELVAPGMVIRSSYRGGGYREISGTSMAAPYVAAAIALMREYNPDATVEEIKNALIQSATDLGTTGKDNDYGWGFLNVARALQYLPAPQKPTISMIHLEIADNPGGVMMPGMTTPLSVAVSNSIVPVTDLWGQLRSSDTFAAVLLDSIYFGDAYNGQSLSNDTMPFLVKLDHRASLGATVNYDIDFFSRQLGFLNTVPFSVIIGQPVIAEARRVHNERVSIGVSNFCLSREIADQESGDNWLSSGGLLVAVPNGAFHDCVPGDLDFVAVDTLNITGSAEKTESLSRYRTQDAAIEITQKTSLYNQAGWDNFVLQEYSFDAAIGNLPETLVVGYSLDIDLSGGELISQDERDLIYRDIDGGKFVGIRVLNDNLLFARSVSGVDYKAGTIGDLVKEQMIAYPLVSLSSQIGDHALIFGAKIIASSPQNPSPFALVLAIGNSLTDVNLGLVRGELKYFGVTDAGEPDDAVLPRQISLEQNFPNPFNAETVIRFSLPAAGEYRLEIFNILGERIKTYGRYAESAGRQEIRWDGRNEKNVDVATGVYLYRIVFEGNSLTRKMVLLK